MPLFFLLTHCAYQATTRTPSSDLREICAAYTKAVINFPPDVSTIGKSLGLVGHFETDVFRKAWVGNEALQAEGMDYFEHLSAVEGGPGGQTLFLHRITGADLRYGGKGWFIGPGADMRLVLERVSNRYQNDGMILDPEALSRLSTMIQVNRDRSEDMEVIYLSGSSMAEGDLAMDNFIRPKKVYNVDESFKKGLGFPPTYPDTYATAALFYNPKEIVYPKILDYGHLIDGNAPVGGPYIHVEFRVPIPEREQGLNVALVNRFMITTEISEPMRALFYEVFLDRMEKMNISTVYVEASDDVHARLFRRLGFEIVQDVPTHVYGGEKVIILKAPLTKIREVSRSKMAASPKK